TGALKKGLDNGVSLLQRFKSSSLGMLGTIGVGMGGAFAMNEAVAAAKEQAGAEKRLKNVLEATGHAAGFQAEELMELARQRQRVTNFGDEMTTNAMANMATFKNVSGDVFTDALKSAQDLSATFGTELVGNATTLGRILDNPVAGMKA